MIKKNIFLLTLISSLLFTACGHEEKKDYENEKKNFDYYSLYYFLSTSKAINASSCEIEEINFNGLIENINDQNFDNISDFYFLINSYNILGKDIPKKARAKIISTIKKNQTKLGNFSFSEKHKNEIELNLNYESAFS